MLLACKMYLLNSGGGDLVAATVQGRRHDNWHLYGDAQRFTVIPLILGFYGEFPIKNGIRYAISGNGYTISLNGLPADTLVDVGNPHSCGEDVPLGPRGGKLYSKGTVPKTRRVHPQLFRRGFRDRDQDLRQGDEGVSAACLIPVL